MTITGYNLHPVNIGAMVTLRVFGFKKYLRSECLGTDKAGEASIAVRLILVNHVVLA